MKRFRQILGTASLTAQFLGLGLAILLLTNVGRYAVTHFGLVPVLLAALVLFLVAEGAIVGAITYYRTKAEAGIRRGMAAVGSLKPDQTASHEQA